VAIEAGDALVGGEGATVFGGVELRLGKRRDEEPAMEARVSDHVWSVEEIVKPAG